MAQSPIVNALIEKRAELAGLIADYQRKQELIRADLAHIDATLRLFAPDVMPHAIRAKHPARPRLEYFANGEIGERCRTAIREANGESVSVEDITRKAMEDKGLDQRDNRLRAVLVQKFLWSLQRMAQHGKVARIGKGAGARWALPAGAEEE